MKFYRGSAAAARSYVEADRSRVDDYYLAEGTGLATRYAATPVGVRVAESMDGPTYERWVAGYDIATGHAKGRLRRDERGLRFVEVVVNGPKTWSLAASLHPEIAQAYDKAQDRAAAEIIGWLAEHATTRVGPRGRQVQIPVEQVEAAVVRHYTSRAGDPHRHLHLQVNVRVFATGRWRGLHSVGVVDSIGGLNGIGHAAVMCDPRFREALATYGYRLENESGEIIQLSPYVGEFSARAAQISRNVDRYEAQWRTDHPGEEPGAGLRRIWDRRAWAQARPDKVVPKDGAQLTRRWREELRDLGFTPPTAADHGPISPVGMPVGRIDRDAVAGLAISRLGARRSSWNTADIRGEVERLVAAAHVVAEAVVRRELVEDLTHRALERCVPLLARTDVPEHVRALTSRDVLDVEADLITRLAARAQHPGRSLTFEETVHGDKLDPTQQRAVGALAGTGQLVVIEGAAGSGKTTTLTAAREWLEVLGRGLVVVTPTLKAAHVVEQQVGTAAFTAAWLIHQYGYRWDDDGHWTRHEPAPTTRARLRPLDLLLVDEAGMLDQDTAGALLTIADETGARIAFVGDRHQLPAVGRGGVLDLAARWARPEARLDLDTVHRFTDPEYAQLSLLMRTGERSGEVFDALVSRGEIVVHHTPAELTTALTTTLTTGLTTGSGDGLVIADTREQVAALNAAIRDHRLTTGHTTGAGSLTTQAGEQIGVGDKIATRRNDPDLGVANRDTWTVTGIGADGGLVVRGRAGARTLPRAYVREHVELAYATTVYGAQGETVHTADVVIAETTGAAAAYVGMTRGRTHNTAHLVAENLVDARTHWIEVFGRDRADLGPGHATRAVIDAIDRYGPNAPQHAGRLQAAAILHPDPPHRSPRPGTTPRPASPGIDF